MTTRFNFLAPRIRVQQTIDALRRQHPNKPDNWVRQQAVQAAANHNVTHELRAPGQFHQAQKGKA